MKICRLKIYKTRVAFVNMSSQNFHTAMKLTIFTVIVGLSWVVAYPLSENEGTEWWRTALFYQIYPRSFQDTDRNGVGDLNGKIFIPLRFLGIRINWIFTILV